MKSGKTGELISMGLMTALLWATPALAFPPVAVPAEGAMGQLGAVSGKGALIDFIKGIGKIVSKPAPKDNFGKCLDIYTRTYVEADAADRCYQLAPGYTFIDNPDFDACYSLYSQTYTSAHAADTCVRNTRLARFDANFKRCFGLYNKSYTAADAADRCMACAPSFRFAGNPDFDACYSVYSKTYTSAHAADTCVDRLR